MRDPILRISAAIALLAAPLPLMADPLDRDPTPAGAITIIGANVHKERCTQTARSGGFDQRGLDACTQALAAKLKDADKADVLVNRGVLNTRQRDMDAAIVDFDAALALKPDHAEAMLNKAIALVQKRDYKAAAPLLTQAMTLGVSQPHKAYFNRGAVREALGDPRGAYEDYSTALQIKPDWGPAEAELARFARGRRDQLAARLGPEAPGPN